jgi:cold-inducible RNA-binding protein
MGTKLYVGNLNYNTTEDMLREAFSGNGREVASVSIIMDRETGRSRGFAFVEMSTSEGAQQALQELDGADLDGRTLRINEARERDARGPGGPPRSFGGPPRSFGGPPGGGGGYAGGGGGYQGRPSGGGFGGPPPAGAPRSFGGPPAPARNFGPPAAPGGARRKEKERGRDDDDRGKKGRRRDQGDGGDGW